MKKESIGGIIVDEDLTFIRIFDLPDKPDWGGSALEEFCFYGLTINFISENIDKNGNANMSISLKKATQEALSKVVESIKKLHENIGVEMIDNVCLLTVYGPHFKDRCGLASTFFRALGVRGINILSISTSISSISAIVEKKNLAAADKALRDVFDVP